MQRIHTIKPSLKVKLNTKLTSPIRLLKGMRAHMPKDKAVITSIAVVGAIGLMGIASLSWATAAHNNSNSNNDNSNNGSNARNSNADTSNNEANDALIRKLSQDEVNTQKLATVQKMYELSRQLETGSATLLSQFASDELKDALALEQQVMEQEGLMCGIGADIIWQSQDPDYHEPITFALNDEGEVVVALSDRDELRYQLSCQVLRSSAGEQSEQDLQCQIEDIIDFAGSVKQSLIENCQ